MGAALDGAEFGLQMIRFPYRQVFGDTTVTGETPDLADVFRPVAEHGGTQDRFRRAME